MRCAAVVGVLALTAALLPAQGEVTLCGADAAVRLVGPTATTLRGPRAHHAALPAGDYVVHFAPDADGQPLPLAFAVSDGAAVQIAVATVAAAPWRDVSLAGEAWTEHPGEWATRTCRDGAEASQRLAARVCPSDGTTGFGIVTRWRADQQWSRCVWDLERRELRIERGRSDGAIVMGRAPAPATAPGQEHELTLQVSGFRVQVFVDAALVLQCFDGGSAPGAFGLCHRGEAPTWRSLATLAPSAASTSAVAVRDGATLALHVAAPWSPGCPYVLELALDRPHPLVLAPNGVESLLLSPPAAPQVLVADWRGTLAPRSTGELGADGVVRVAVPRPSLPAVFGQVALARLLFVPGGELVVAVSPAVPLAF